PDDDPLDELVELDPVRKNVGRAVRLHPLEPHGVRVELGQDFDGLPHQQGGESSESDPAPDFAHQGVLHFASATSAYACETEVPRVSISAALSTRKCGRTT